MSKKEVWVIRADLGGEIYLAEGHGASHGCWTKDLGAVQLVFLSEGKAWEWIDELPDFVAIKDIEPLLAPGWVAARQARRAEAGGAHLARCKS